VLKDDVDVRMFDGVWNVKIVLRLSVEYADDQPASCV